MHEDVLPGPGPSPGPPPGPDYDPLRPAQREDPFPVYARLREETPVFHSPELDAWIVTRFEDVVAILLDNKRFSAVNSIGIDAFTSFPPEVQAVFDQGYERFPGMIEMDPPMHTRYRSLVNTAFTPRRVASLEPRIQEIADDLIDGFAAEGRIEFLRRFGFPLPMTVICEMLGVPGPDMLHVQELADGFRTLEAGTMWQLPVEEQLEVARSFVAFQQYVAALVADRRRDPREDLVGTLVEAQLAGERPLNDEELISLVIHFLFAGQETTARLFGSFMYMVLAERSRWEAIVADPTRAADAFEEALRLEPPVTYHHRLAKEDVVMGGVLIPAGATVHLHFASANHDGSAFTDPEAFEPGREGLSRHLGFGRGVHFCVGAPVARLEGRIAIETLARRLPGMRLVDGQVPQHEPHLMLRGLERLEVEWDPATVRPRA